MDKKNFLENLILSDENEKLAYLETLKDEKATVQPQKSKGWETPEIDLHKMVKTIFGIK